MIGVVAGAEGEREVCSVSLHWIKSRMVETPTQPGDLHFPGTVQAQAEQGLVKAAHPGSPRRGWLC